MNLAFDLFLLTFNLSQLHNKELIIKLFTEGMQEIFKPAEFKFIESGKNSSGMYFKIKTSKSSFGVIEAKLPEAEADINKMLIDNSVQMLAVILEHLEFDQRLEKERDGFKRISVSKLTEIEGTVKELKDARSASINLIEDLNQEIERRKDAENAIQKAEKYYRFLIENAPDGVVLVNLAGKMTYASPAARSIFGYPDILVEMPDPNASTHPDDLPLVLSTIQDLVQNPGKVTTIQYRFRRSDGNWLWVESTFANHFADEGIEALVINFRDITAKKAAEDSLIESEEKFRNLFEHSPIGKSMTNIDGSIYVNAAFCKILGYSEEELCNTKWPDISHPGDVPMTNEIIKSLIDGHKVKASFEKRYIHKNGSTIFTELSTFLQRDKLGVPQFFITTINDITERKKLEADKFQLLDIIDKSLNEIYIIDSDTLKFEYANKGALKNLGYSIEEMINLTLSDIKPEYPEALFRETVNPLISGEKEVLVFETFHRRKNGTTYPVDIHLQYYSNNEAGLFLAVLNDITERKKADEELIASYALLRAAGKVAKMGGWNVNLAENISFLSDEVAAIHEVPSGYSPPLNEAYNFYAPEYRQRIEEVFSDCANNGVQYDEEMELITSTGKRVWVRTGGEAVRDQSGVIVKVQGFFQDISEQKQAQMELIRRESFLNKVFDVLPIGLWFADSNGKLLKGNPAGVDIWGAEPTVPIEEYGVFKARRLPSRAELSGTDWALAHTIAEGVTIKDELLEIDSFDGKKKVVLNYTAPVLDNNGNMLGAIVVNNEITDRVRAHEEIQKLNDELEKRVIERTSQLLAANKELEAFSYSVSHDLRAPLRAIHSFTRILSEDYKDTLDDEGRRICGIIESSSVHLGQLIDDLLSFSRIGRTHLQAGKISMSRMARTVMSEIISPQEKERIHFSVEKIPPAHGDAVTIKQVMTNLLSNAVKYTSGKEEAEISVGFEDNDGEIVYFVKDNGVGFDMQYVGKLFGVFQRLHSARDFEGNGVGLAIVQRIVHRHGGKVWAEGEIDKGATFFFTLPGEKAIGNRQ